MVVIQGEITATTSAPRHGHDTRVVAPRWHAISGLPAVTKQPYVCQARHCDRLATAGTWFEDGDEAGGSAHFTRPESHAHEPAAQSGSHSQLAPVQGESRAWGSTTQT